VLHSSPHRAHSYLGKPTPIPTWASTIRFSFHTLQVSGTIRYTCAFVPRVSAPLQIYTSPMETHDVTSSMCATVSHQARKRKMASAHRPRPCTLCDRMRRANYGQDRTTAWHDLEPDPISMDPLSVDLCCRRRSPVEVLRHCVKPQTGYRVIGCCIPPCRCRHCEMVVDVNSHNVVTLGQQ
jgi:hypothetical protein